MNRQCGLRQSQTGFSLVGAIFLVVVLAGMAVYIATIGSVQTATMSMALQGARAYQAAAAGSEWGMHEALSNVVTTCGAAPSTPTTTTFSLTFSGGLSFNVSVDCEYSIHQERSDIYNIYMITSTASSGSFGQEGFVSRSIRVAITDAP
ncbi:hypothetical protein [Sedimenticola sp.]|uniref:hypothetical protein n=1 Tax=Sedimenticola sp. TaxID=1940285 RepID=UPI003D1324C0